MSPYIHSEKAKSYLRVSKDDGFTCEYQVSETEDMYIITCEYNNYSDNFEEFIYRKDDGPSIYRWKNNNSEGEIKVRFSMLCFLKDISPLLDELPRVFDSDSKMYKQMKEIK